MKVSLKHLERSLAQIKFKLLGWSSDEKDLEILVSMIKADPGSGVMTDCLEFSAVKPDGPEDSELKMSVEVYPMSEGVDPAASKIESYKVIDKY
jgi:hypothetical protein